MPMSNPDGPPEQIARLYHKYAGEPGLRELAGRGLIPPRIVLGRGPIPPRAVMIGEAPGAAEAREGAPFVGPSGQLMAREMKAAGLDPADFWITNAVKIRPPANRAPDDDELDASRPYLLSELAIVGATMKEPRLVIALGGTAATTLRDQRISISRVANGLYDLVLAESGSWKVFYIFHPAAALRSNDVHQRFTAGMHQIAKYLDA